MLLVIAFLAVLSGGRSVSTNVDEPVATIAANTDRIAEGVESLPTVIGRAVSDAGAANLQGQGVVSVWSTKDCRDIAQAFNVNPDWLTAFGTNGCYLNAPSPATVDVPEGWRLDFTDENGVDNSCSSSQKPGIYGPRQRVATPGVATFWFVPGETKCPWWSGYGKTHAGDYKSADTASGSGGNAAPTPPPDKTAHTESRIGDDVNDTSGQTALIYNLLNVDQNASTANLKDAWNTYINGYGNIVSGPDQYGGIVVDVSVPKTLPEGFMAQGSTNIGEHGGNRTMSPGRWTVYPPYSWRDILGFSA